jgi:hypothetical protein
MAEKFSDFNAGATTVDTKIVGYDSNLNTNNKYDLSQLADGIAPHIVQSHQVNGLATRIGDSSNLSNNPRQAMFACSMASALNSQGPCMIVNNDFTVTKVQIKWLERHAPVIPVDGGGETATVNWELGKLADTALSSDTNNGQPPPLGNFTSVLALPALQCTSADTGTWIYKDSGAISASYTAGDILILYFSAPTDVTMKWDLIAADMTVAMTIEY